MSEIWKPIVGYEKDYWVSDRGRVLSKITGKILRPGIASNGYPTVSLRGATRTVHSLVAEAFLGSRPHNAQVCHNDGNRKNAALANLRYGTPKENNLDMDVHGTRLRGTGYHNAKLTEDTAREIRQLKGVIPQSELAKIFRVSPAAIQAVHDGRTWKHV